MVSDWLAEGLDGRSEETVKLNRNVLKPVVAYLGDVELRKLTAHDVRRALTRLAATHSTRTVVVTHNALTRAIRHAEANRHVLHNVAALVDTPTGQKGRPSQALTAEQAVALLAAAQDARLGAYVVLCLLTGIRTEEARALRWDHVDVEEGTIARRSGCALTPASLPSWRWMPPTMRCPPSRPQRYGRRGPAGPTFNVKAFSLFTHHPPRWPRFRWDLRPIAGKTGKDRVHFKDLGPAVADEVRQRFRPRWSRCARRESWDATLLQFPLWIPISMSTSRGDLSHGDS
jgi:integrase